MQVWRNAKCKAGQGNMSNLVKHKTHLKAEECTMFDSNMKLKLMEDEASVTKCIFPCRTANAQVLHNTLNSNMTNQWRVSVCEARWLFMTCMCHAFCISCDSDAIYFPCFTSAVPPNPHALKPTHATHIHRLRYRWTHTQTCHTVFVIAANRVTCCSRPQCLICDCMQRITTYGHLFFLFFLYLSMYLPSFSLSFQFLLLLACFK